MLDVFQNRQRARTKAADALRHVRDMYNEPRVRFWRVARGSVGALERIDAHVAIYASPQIARLAAERLQYLVAENRRRGAAAL